MKKILLTSIIFCAIFFACNPSAQHTENNNKQYSDNEILLQPQAETQRQKEEDQQFLYKQQLIDLQAQLLMEETKLKGITNNQQEIEQLKIIEELKAEIEKVKQLVQ